MPVLLVFQGNVFTWSDGSPVNFLPAVNKGMTLPLLPLDEGQYRSINDTSKNNCVVLILLSKQLFITNIECTKSILEHYVCKYTKTSVHDFHLQHICPLNMYLVKDKCISLMHSNTTNMDLKPMCIHQNCDVPSLGAYARAVCLLMEPFYSFLIDIFKSKCVIYKQTSTHQQRGELIQTNALNLTFCGPGQYQCMDGSCILESYVCDGYIDCKGAVTDETDCVLCYHNKEPLHDVDFCRTCWTLCRKSDVQSNPATLLTISGQSSAVFHRGQG